MSKNHSKKTGGSLGYKKTLRQLQIELVKLQNTLIKSDAKILIIFEGRDSSGKDGTIKRITEHLSPRETRVVALGKPSDKDLSCWYFQRYTAHLPSALRKWFYLIVAGTTAPVLNASWRYVVMSNIMSFWIPC